jgi:hypothetical protein
MRDERQLSGTHVNEGAVAKAPIGGGVASILSAPLCSPFGIAIDDRNAYFTTSCGDRRLGAMPLGGGATTSMVEDGTRLPSTSIVADGTSVYLADSSTTDTRVVKAPRDGGAATTLVTSP